MNIKRGFNAIIFLLFLLVTLIIGDYFTGGDLLSPVSYSGPHQPINAWKIYEIQKNNLNPLQYDVQLQDLNGGRFVSYWDTPLPYLVSIVFSRFLFFLGDGKFLVAIKLTTLLNYILSYLSIYILLRYLGIRRCISLAVSSIFLLIRASLMTLIALNTGGLWALSLPIFTFLKLRREGGIRNSFYLGISFGLSYLQNPYYGFFVTVFLSVPLLVYLSSKMFKRPFSSLGSFMVIVLTVLVLITSAKGSDIYKVKKDNIQDPEERNYILRQVRVYRPWYHLNPPSGHIFENLINPPLHNFINFLKNKGYIDYLTLWFPDANNPYYLGLFNILLFVLLLVLSLKFSGTRSSFRYLPFIFTLMIGMVIFLRADAFILGKHYAFPWLRLQNALPFTSLHYYPYLVILVFYIALALMLEKLTRYLSVIGSRKRILIGFIFILFLSVGTLEVWGRVGDSCVPDQDQKLNMYLSNNQRNRLFIQLSAKCDSQLDPYKVSDSQVQSFQLSRDARYYQIFHKTKIYAPDSLSWLDYYRYGKDLSELRTLETIITDKNNRRLSETGVEEIVLFMEYVDADSYWKNDLSPIYKSVKEYKVFDHSIIFYVPHL